MPPSRKPTSSHSSRPSRPSGSSHHSSHSSHSSYHRPSSHSNHSSYHRPPHHSGYSSSSGGGFFSGMLLGSLLSNREQAQDRSTTVINQQIVTAPQPKMYECPYCLGRVTGTPSADGLSALTCPNCGGVLSEANAIAQPDPVQQTYSQPTQTYSSSPDTSIRAYPNQPSLGEKLKSCITTVIGLAIVGLICGGIFWGLSRSQNHSTPQQGYYEEYHEDYAPGGHEDSIYVDVLGRTVYWDNEYDMYYDPGTDCYFFMNYDMDPPVWQYWFEGVSSKYGEKYGWLEWDYNERCWYVQKSKSSWVKLPENEYTEWLWHMD